MVNWLPWMEKEPPKEHEPQPLQLPIEQITEEIGPKIEESEESKRGVVIIELL